MAAALAGSRQKKKKWNKGKMREKINAKVLFDEDGWLRLQAEVPKVRICFFFIISFVGFFLTFYFSLP